MRLLSSLLVGRPLHILVVAALFAIGYLVARSPGHGAGRPRWLLGAAAAWAAYAAWEWLVLVRTPEADIRADLLLIWPVLAILSGWALFRVWR